MKKDNIDKFVEEVRRELLLSGAAGNGALVGLWAVFANALSSTLLRSFGPRVADLALQYEVRIQQVRYNVDTAECFYTLEHSDEVREVKVV